MKNRVRTTVLMLVAVMTGVSVISVTAAPQAKKSSTNDWSHWRGPNRDGISVETGWLGAWPASGPKQVWQAELGTGFASVAICDGKVYSMGNTGKQGKEDDDAEKDVIFCLDANTGKEIWKKSYPCNLIPRNYEGGPGATPTVEGNRVYTLSKQGHAHCFDAQTGNVIWSRDLQKEEGMKPPTWGFAGSPLIQGNLVILNVGSAGTALNKATGKVVWKSQTAVAGYSTPLPFKIDGKEGVAMFTDKEIVAVNAADGKEIWQYPWETDYDINAADPIFIGDRVFLSSGYKTGCAMVQISEGQFKELWRHKNMRNQCNSSVFWKGYIYGFDGNVGGSGILRCLDVKTGEETWSHKGLGTGSLMLADEKLIILSEKGELVIARATPKEFEVLQRSQILSGKCWTMPVLSNGKIYARNAEGKLVCVSTK
jgi:outer membrane protein assembly factor BamB